MHDPRTSTALRQLDDLGQGPAPSRWRWSIAMLEARGRIVLPAHARDALAGLNLRRRDLDTRRATVWLREKSGSHREQPISPSLVALLERHATSRDAATPDAAVLRTRRGAPVTARRYDIVFDRARRCLDWTDRAPVSAHVLRHTAITAVGRHAGYPVAQAFAGHAPPSVTGLYMHVHPTEVAAAIADLTGEPHPLTNDLPPRHRNL